MVIVDSPKVLLPRRGASTLQSLVIRSDTTKTLLSVWWIAKIVYRLSTWVDTAPEHHPHFLPLLEESVCG